MNRTVKVNFTIVFSLFFFVSCSKDALSPKEKKALFATPTAAETQAVRDEWQSRDLNPTDYSVLQQESVLNGAFTLKMLSYRLNGIKEYAAILAPQTNSPVPVHIHVGGFGLESTLNSVNMMLDTSGAGPSNILAIPALRGQSLQVTLNGSTYTTPVSEGEHCNAFDGGTDDVLALLNLLAQTEPYADVNRTAVRGGSRGGTVALLAGIRDPRVKRVVAIAGPVDMLELTSEHQKDPTYRCQFLDAFTSGQTTLEEARRKLIASSPLYFAQHLPLTQMHMGTRDFSVPEEQGHALEQKMAQLGLSAQLELYMYDRTHTDLVPNNPELAARIEQFLASL